MIHAAIRVEINTSMPNDAQTTMMTRRIRSSLTDAQRSIAFKMPVTLVFTMPDPAQATQSKSPSRMPDLSWKTGHVRVFCYVKAIFATYQARLTGPCRLASSAARYRYQVASERCGAQARPISPNSLGFGCTSSPCNTR